MHKNAELIDRFYSAFQKRDAKGMAACYHQDVEFSDNAFGPLRGDRARAMWAMLCEGGKDLKIEFRDVRVDDRTGTAPWEAWYTFSGTGKKVHNIIDARFEFRDGLISRHVDTFDFHRWAGQALGFPGKLLGGTAFIRNKVRSMALKRLGEFQKTAGAS